MDETNPTQGQKPASTPPEYVSLAVQAAGPSRLVKLMGHDYRVVPAVLVQEQVLNNNLGRTFLPAEEITDDWAKTANGMPVLTDHPSRRGMPVSGRDPYILNELGVGFMFNARAEGAAVKADVYLDVSRGEAVPDLKVILEKLDAGQTPELSTGFPLRALEMTPGVHNGKEYDIVMRPSGFDHLAVFAEAIGACSVEEGCGLGVNHAGPCQAGDDDQPAAENASDGGDVASAGSAEASDETASTPEGAPSATPDAATEPPTHSVMNWLRSLFRDIFTGPRNISDEDRTEQLRAALQEKFGGPKVRVWVVATYTEEGEVVYEAWDEEDSGTVGMFRVQYEIAEDGAVTLGDPEEVRRVTSFEPVANEGTGNPTPQERSTMNREQIIAHLAEAGPLDREALGKLTDCQLKALMGANGQPGDTNQPAANRSSTEDEAWRIAHEYRQKYEELAAQAANALDQEDRERARLLDDLLYRGASVPWGENELKAMTLPQLRKVYNAIYPDASFSGRGGPRAPTAPVSNFDFAQQPILGAAPSREVN